MVVALGPLIVVAAPPAHASVFTVTSGNDDGPGSFRQAIADASADTDGSTVIEFTPDLSVNLAGDVSPPIYTGTSDLTTNGNGLSISGRAGTLASSAGVTTVEDLEVSGGRSSFGGAISTEGDLHLVDSTFTGNGDRFASGGAVATRGDVSITDSTFSHNSVGFFNGGAVLAFGDVSVTGSTFGFNASEVGNGGAIAAGGEVSVTDSTFTANTGGIGGAISADDTVRITGSTFSTNSAISGGAAEGEALSIINSTSSYNSADSGAGIFTGGEATLSYTTLVGNSAAKGANVAAASLTSFGSVVADPGGGVNCSVGSTGGSLYSYDDDASCGFSGTGSTSGGPDPATGVLGSYGGPTSTRVPGGLSPLLDAIPVSACDPGVTTDQRGLARPQGPGCDIGAVEVQVQGARTAAPTARPRGSRSVPCRFGTGRSVRRRSGIDTTAWAAGHDDHDPGKLVHTLAAPHRLADSEGAGLGAVDGVGWRRARGLVRRSRSA